VAAKFRSMLLPAVWAAILICHAWIGSLLAPPPPVGQLGPVVTGAPGYPTQTVDGQLRPVGFRQLTDVSGVTSLPTVSGAELVLIQAESQNIRIRDDGVAPTTTVGFAVFAGDTLWYNGADLTDLQVIEEAASATVNLLFYGY